MVLLFVSYIDPLSLKSSHSSNLKKETPFAVNFLHDIFEINEVSDGINEDHHSLKEGRESMIEVFLVLTFQQGTTSSNLS